MDFFNDFNHPKAKKWRKWQYHKKFNPFPVDEISDGNRKFTGYFTGTSVELFDVNEICEIYDNGAYGIGMLTKGTPSALYTVMATKRSLEQADENTPDPKKVTTEQAVMDNELYDVDMEPSMLPLAAQRIVPIPLLEIEPPPESQSLNIAESLVLFPEEAVFLHYTLKCLRIFDAYSDNELSINDLLTKIQKYKPDLITNYVAYHYFRSQNWVVKCGLKFGGHFLLYYKGPQFYHASYIVIVQEYREQDEYLMEFKELQGLYRLGETCKKDILFLQVKYPDNLTAANGMQCLENISNFQVRQMVPKRFQWDHLNSIVESGTFN